MTDTINDMAISVISIGNIEIVEFLTISICGAFRLDTGYKAVV